MARSNSIRKQQDFMEVKAIRLLSCWLEQPSQAGDEDNFDSDPYSSDLDIAADYLLAKSGR